MNFETIKELAKVPKLSKDAMDAKLSELKSHGAELLSCILYVKTNQNCSLSEANDIVLDSSAWKDQKETFLRHQEEMFEEFLADSKDEIQEIQQTYTPDGTHTTVFMKPKVANE